HLDHGNLRPQRAIDAGHLQADDAAADDQQAFGHVGQLQRPGRVHHAIVVFGQAGNLNHARAGGDDALVEIDRAPVAVMLDRQFVVAAEGAHALHDFDLALPGHAGQAAGELFHHRVLEAAQLVEIDVGLAEGYAVLAQLRGRIDDLTDVQQRLGRNAADVETDPAD